MFMPNKFGGYPACQPLNDSRCCGLALKTLLKDSPLESLVERLLPQSLPPSDYGSVTNFGQNILVLSVSKRQRLVKPILSK
jgi:hypothetical protein